MKKKLDKLKKPKKKWIKYSFRKYSQEYPDWFKQEKKGLSKLLPNSKIEHIGSTAVPGLGGKGIIDIAILTSKTFLKTAKKKISNYGYEQWPVKKERKFFSFVRYHKSKENPKKVFHIHITSDKDVFEIMLLFREYLLSHPKVSHDYAKLKKKAVKLCHNQYGPYVKLKNPFIKSVLKKAKKEEEKTIKAIVFDIQGVVCHKKFGEAYPSLIKKFKLDKEEFRQARRKYINKYLVGEYTPKEYFSSISNDLRVKNHQKFASLWKAKLPNLLKPDKEMQRTIKNLKKNYKIIAFTNVTPDHEIFRVKNKVYQHFHQKVLSIQEKDLKPNLSFYKTLIKKSNMRPKEMILVDDWEENLLPAKKLGMKTILFKNNKQLIKELKKSGVKVK